MVWIIKFVTFPKKLTNIKKIILQWRKNACHSSCSQHFEVYLTSSSSPIVVFSDHNPLTFIHKMKNKNQRLLRWILLLQKHNLDIRHIRGKDNIVPDALSRA